jgi:hypothetical protein
MSLYRAQPKALFDIDRALVADLARQSLIDLEIAALCQESADLDARRDILLDLRTAERARV